MLQVSSKVLINNRLSLTLKINLSLTIALVMLLYQIKSLSAMGQRMKSSKIPKFENFTSTPQLSSAMRRNLLRQASLIEIFYIVILNMLLQHALNLI